jgi:hypothetical protein
MSKKNKGRNPPWTPFENATKIFPLSQEDRDKGTQVWQNSKYVVFIDYDGIPKEGQAWSMLVHLSIKRHDKSHEAHDWRDMQRIKNELIGPECEGFEMFPAESRVIDTSNQYHMYVFPESKMRIPVGYTQRMVLEGSFGGAVQRDWRPKESPKDLIRGDEAKNVVGQAIQKMREDWEAHREEYLKEKKEEAKKVPE